MKAIPTTSVIRKPDEAALEAAADLLRAGQLVAFPTETVYGLGADATSGEAVARIYAAKDRPRFNPLIAHVATPTEAEDLAIFDERAKALAHAFWPGPLTLVLPKAPDCPVSDLATAGLDTIAVRVPDHDLARILITLAGRPIAAPSANRSGHVSPTTAAHVAADLRDRVAMIVDGGPTTAGLESTIVDLTDRTPKLLRAGALPADMIEAVLGAPLIRHTVSAHPTAPGQLASHYAPRCHIRLNATEPEPGEAFVRFGPTPHRADFALSVDGDLLAAAARLYGLLRALDDKGWQRAAFMPIPAHGLGEAINDRLARAAAPR